jgi:hypothetical protein
MMSNLKKVIDAIEHTRRPVLLLEGRRTVAEEWQDKLRALGKHLAERLPSAIFRSGNAYGSDLLFAEGVASVDPTRLELIVPYGGHRKAHVPEGARVIELVGKLSDVVKEEIRGVSTEASPEARSLFKGRYSKGGRAKAKASYLMRDTLKVIGDPDRDLARAAAGIFYIDEDPMAGGTGHTIRVCQKVGVPWVSAREIITEFNL